MAEWVGKYHTQDRLIMSDPLFRQKALKNKRTQHYGSVLINIPVHYLVLTGGITALIIAVCLLFFFGQFSEKFVVRGYLNSSKGIVRVYPNKNGVIKKRFIHHGQFVQKGDPLFLIDTSSERMNQHRSILNNLIQQKQAIKLEISYKKNELHQLKPLLDKNYISLSVYHNKHQEIAALENRKNLVDMECIRYQQSQSYMIRAPIAGHISSVLYHLGQYTSLSKPLAQLLPDHATLIAEFFIPVRHAGFLKKDNPILIRYDAYPSARFGSASAVILEISRSILTDEEEDKPFTMGEPYYKVTAKLEKQSIMIYGKEHPIQHGMTLSGMVIGSKKKLWQWVLDPLYSYYGSVVE